MNSSTPVYKDIALSEYLGVDLYIKRDDLYPISGGGSKGRKADYILNTAVANKHDSVVTCGGAQSNHVRATAIKCRELGLECTIVIHAPEPVVITGNYKILIQLGVRIVHCEQKEVAKVMDREMLRFYERGLNPLYIWGGGHCIEGTRAYYEAVTELKEQLSLESLDFIVHASGTGTTQAGLICGALNLYQSCKVIGISVARDKFRGQSAVYESVTVFCEEQNLSIPSLEVVDFQDEFNCGGYEKTNAELTELINTVSKISGLILDETYTGKAFLGLVENIKSGRIQKGDTVVFWHTGGLLNLLSVL
ncbi:1-aminocyclopropane-1-carboxylate deaminase/D-cysteine desulfhydrase [Vibrio breoganii]